MMMIAEGGRTNQQEGLVHLGKEGQVEEGSLGGGEES